MKTQKQLTKMIYLENTTEEQEIWIPRLEEIIETKTEDDD